MKIEDRLYESQRNVMSLQREVNALIDELRDSRYLYSLKVQKVEELEGENSKLAWELAELHQEHNRLKKNS